MGEFFLKEGFVKEFLVPIIKSVLFSIILTLISILIFALIVKITVFSSIAVKIVNQFIKVISIFLGALLFLKEGKGLIKGGITGLLYVFLINAIFSLISGKGFTISILEVLLCLVVGVISGIISINLKEK